MDITKDIDPTVQVALVSVFTTVITTIGIILVAFINGKRDTNKVSRVGFYPGMSEREVLSRVLILVSEVDACEDRNAELEKENFALQQEVNRLNRVLERLNRPDPPGPPQSE